MGFLTGDVQAGVQQRAGGVGARGGTGDIPGVSGPSAELLT